MHLKTEYFIHRYFGIAVDCLNFQNSKVLVYSMTSIYVYLFRFSIDSV